MFTLIIFILGVLTLAYYWKEQRYNYWKRRGVPHDAPRLPMGNLNEAHKTIQLSHFYKEMYKKYKDLAPYAGCYFYLSKAIIVNDITLIKNILIKDFSNFESRGMYTNERDDPLRGHLVSLEGERWRRLRQKLSPTFTSGKMKYMFPTVLQVAQDLSKVLVQKASDTNILEITNLMCRYSADVIGSCAFGIECNSLQNENAEFVKMGNKAITERRHGRLLDLLTFAFPKVAHAMRLKVTPQDVEDFYTRIVRETLNYRVLHKIKRNDFMDLLIKMKQKRDEGNEAEGLTINELTAQAYIFFLGGFETSATTMGYALYELARHQDVQQKLREEIQEVLSRHNDEFSYECLKEMQYMDMVINETLRKYPALAHLIRKANAHYVPEMDAKYFIEAGTTVIIPTLGIHYDPEFYPEPEKFIPERFTDDAIKSRPACTWLPFGDGPRNCIGMRFGKMQTSIGLACLIKNLKFEIAAETVVPLKFKVKSVVLHAENGIKLKVSKV